MQKTAKSASGIGDEPTPNSRPDFRYAPATLAAEENFAGHEWRRHNDELLAKFANGIRLLAADFV